MVSTLTGIVSGAIFSSVSYIEGNYPRWASLLIALLPPLVGCILDVLVRKKVITKERSDEIEGAIKSETDKFKKFDNKIEKKEKGE